MRGTRIDAFLLTVFDESHPLAVADAYFHALILAVCLRLEDVITAFFAFVIICELASFVLRPGTCIHTAAPLLKSRAIFYTLVVEEKEIVLTTYQCVVALFHIIRIVSCTVYFISLALSVLHTSYVI